MAKLMPDDRDQLKVFANNIRRHVVRMTHRSGGSHIGTSFSMVDILTVLYNKILKLDPRSPNSQERDRFILSKGHGCLALYAILADKGFFSKDELKTFCKSDSILGGHPERPHVPGVEASTGALGHGLSIGVGMAIAAKITNKEHKVVVITGDGEINEGAIWEAVMSASKHKLSNLSLWIDSNKLQSYGLTSEVLDLDPLADKFISFGFEVLEVDGHDVSQIRKTTTKIPTSLDRPTVVICHTIKGKGLPFAEGNPAWHHKSYLSDEEIADMYKLLA